MRKAFSLARCRAWPPSLLFSAALFGAVAEVWSQSAPGGQPAVAGVEQTVPPDQWLSRLSDGKLSPEQIASGLALALRAQVDDSSKWDPRWGDFIELARQKGAVTDDLWCDYLLGAVRFRVRVGTSARRSAGLHIWYEQEKVRAGEIRDSARAVEIREDDLSGIPIQSADNARSEAMTLSRFGGSGTGDIVDLKREQFATLKPGPQTYHYRYVIQVMEGNSEKILGQRAVEGSFPWRLLAEDEDRPLPALAPDPALRAKVVKSIEINSITRDEQDKTLVQTWIQVNNPPVAMAFDMSLRARGETWPLGPVAWAKGDMESCRIQKHPKDAAALYELGCVLTADGSLPGAMDRFVAARQLEPAKSLLRRIQSQMRRLCGMLLDRGESNDVAAMGALGAAYEHGWGMASDIQEAKRWYRDASNAGNAEAMCRLAAIYERKLGATIFNAQSGRHRGHFSDASRMNGMALFPDASELVTGGDDGKIRFWDFQKAMNKIRDFEKSLTPLPVP